MHDIRLIRENPDAFDAALARRGLEPAGTVLAALDQEHRSYLTKLQEAQARRNEASKEYGILKSGGTPALLQTFAAPPVLGKQMDDVMRPSLIQNLANELLGLKEFIPQAEAAVKASEMRLTHILETLPNLPLADVPDGADEDDNVQVSVTGQPPAFAFTPKEHTDLGPPLGLDFETGVALAGARFTLVRGPAARLHRALGQFMLDHLADHGFEQVIPPLLVRDEIAYGTGQLPKAAEDMFRTTDGRWLIPTSETSLTNIVREKILAEGELPLHFSALTPCFRSEAGAAGRDTRGFIRQHQFEKVEMVSITAPEASDAEHERMTACAEQILVKLGLPFRRMKLCAGDMGFQSARTYDLEVWLPGQGRYREISSVSTCTDFQARRMNARYRPEGEKATRFVHTLNGSGLAVGRTLVAVVENYQQADGSVAVPEVLQAYLGGLAMLEPRA